MNFEYWELLSNTIVDKKKKKILWEIDSKTILTGCGKIMESYYGARSKNVLILVVHNQFKPN